MASTRLRLTLSYSIVAFGTVATFAATLWVMRRATAIADVAREATDLGNRVAIDISKAYNAGEQLTYPDSSTIPPRIVQTYNLQRVVQGYAGFFLVVDRNNRILYKSQEVTRLPKLDPRGRPSTNPIDSAVTDQADSILAYANRIGRQPAPLEVPIVRDATHRTRLVIIAAGGERSEMGPYISQVIVGLPVDIAELPGQVLLNSLLLVAFFIPLLSFPVAHFALGGVFTPVDEMINEVEAISDGRSLHRRLPRDAGIDPMSRLSATLNAMLTRLEASFGGLRRFTADASHELKTPLMVMRADVERAMHPNTLQTDRMVALEEALGEVARMTDLVEGLLVLARADEGRYDLVRDPVHMQPLLHDVFETALILGEEPGLTIVMSGVSDVVVLGDQTRLRHLFLNLLTNAIKYTPKGGRVELAMVRGEEDVTVSVRDTGIGIAASDLPHVFQRFWRADLARSRTSGRAGSGLGLAIAQWSAVAHGGSLTVQSKLGRGSVFTVVLPIVPAADDASRPDAAPDGPAGGPIRSNPVHDFTNS